MAANNVLNISDEQGQLLLDIITRTNKNEERFLYSDFIFKNITKISIIYKKFSNCIFIWKKYSFKF